MMTIVHEVKATKQKKTINFNFAEKQREAKQAQKQSYDNENKGKKTTYEGVQTFYMRTMITTHQKKATKQNKTITLQEKHKEAKHT